MTIALRLVTGRRYRFGRLAALVAGGHAAVVVIFGAVAAVNGDARGLWRLMVRWEMPDPLPDLGWYVLPLVLAGMTQSWALWQILRGRVISLPDPERPATEAPSVAGPSASSPRTTTPLSESEPGSEPGQQFESGSVTGLETGTVGSGEPAVSPDPAGSPGLSGTTASAGPVRALRAVLYVALAFSLLLLVWSRPPWWVSLLDQAGRLALVILFYRTLTGASRGSRYTALAAGALATISAIGSTLGEELGLEIAERVFDVALLDGLPWLLWMSLVLVAQARDGRWRRGTVWTGISYLLLVFLIWPLMYDLIFLGSLGGSENPGIMETIAAFSGNTVFMSVAEALTVLMPVWLARSAHDLAAPGAGAVSRAGAVPRAEAVPRPKPGEHPDHSQRPERPRSPEHPGNTENPKGPKDPEGPARPAPATRGPWPLPAVAVALPLLPAAVNLAHGVPFWIGPRDPIRRLFDDYLLAGRPATLWLCFDAAVGCGGLALLVLAAVWGRTHRLVRVTAGTLLLTAAIGAAAVAVEKLNWSSGVRNIILVTGGSSLDYPDWMSAPGAGDGIPGVSPLWHSAAFTASAIVLLLGYGGRRTGRSPYRTAGTVLVTLAVLCALPVADRAHGPSTARDECAAPQVRTDEYGRLTETAPMSAEAAFVCEVRTTDALPSGRNASDQELVAYGRRLCGVYTRNDPAEIAQVHAVGGVRVPDLTYALQKICPRAAAVVRAGADAEEEEMREWEAENQRMCDAMPRHRLRIRPDSVTVYPEPVWTDYGALEAYEDTEEGDPSGEELYDILDSNGLVAALPGHLAIDVYSDAVTCVTTETYARRPPVETRGWDRVIEVGYRSPTGEIRLADPMGGDELPDLALRGRKGHYRIRVHYAWLPWKGQKHSRQRLLIMAYPGRGDEVIVHRDRTGR
ncbi:hypothetical protein [Streptosporangium sandarakinum]|uniref:hypothetical protein n=1 Tax=Streptosporangium sandarakinum TaxID=1260955 RepID=UPI0033ABBDE1